jgi:chromosomal replication initiator protein
MDQSAVEDIYAVTQFQPLTNFTTPQPDDILESLISALRATVAHPDRAVQALAAEALDRVHAVQEEAKRKLAAQRRGLTVTRLALIIQSVECQFRLEPGTLLRRRRTQRIASLARQLAMFICRSLTSVSYPQIAEAFNRDHSTTLYGYDSIRCRVARDSAFRSFVQRLEREIAGSMAVSTQVAA